MFDKKKVSTPHNAWRPFFSAAISQGVSAMLFGLIVREVGAAYTAAATGSLPPPSALRRRAIRANTAPRALGGHSRRGCARESPQGMLYSPRTRTVFHAGAVPPMHCGTGTVHCRFRSGRCAFLAHAADSG